MARATACGISVPGSIDRDDDKTSGEDHVVTNRTHVNFGDDDDKVCKDCYDQQPEWWAKIDGRWHAVAD